MFAKKIKIGIIQPFINTVGGVEEVIARQVEMLPEFEWTLYGIGFDEGLISKYYPSLTKLKKIKVPNLVGLRLPARFQRREILDTLEVISFFISGFRVKLAQEDILLAHYPFSTIISLFTRKPIIWYCHCLKRYLYEPWIMEEYNKIWGKPSLFFRIIRQFLANLEKKAGHKMASIQCNSKNTREKLEKYIGVRGVVNPPGIAMPKVDVSYEDFVLLPSRLVHYKRVAVAIAAMQYLPQLKLKVVGAGPEETRLKSMAVSLGLKNVEFLEPQDSLDELYKKCLAVIYLSKDEDYGIVPREALAWKKPIIAARDGGGVCEAVIDNENGFLVNVDPTEVAFKLEKLLKNKNLARVFGEKGFKSVKCLTWENHAQKLSEAINELVRIF